MASTIHQSDGHTASTGGRFIDYCQNGNLWYVHRDSSSTLVSFRYSTDGGTTWNLAATSINDALSVSSGYGLSVGFFIDKDDYAHVVYHGSTYAATYRRGTPNAGRTNYTWSSPLNLQTSSTGLTYGGLDVVAHREGTGWVAHCAWLENQPGDGWGWSRLAPIAITAGGSISKTAVFLAVQWGYNVGAFHSIDFRHDADDPKAVQASTPDVYMATTSNDNNNSLLFAKFDYSGGSWSQHGGASTTYGLNDGNPVNAILVSPQLYYDGTRVVCAFIEDGTTTVVRVNEMNVTTLNNTERDPTALSDGVIEQLGCGYDNNQNIHVFAQASTSMDFKKIRYNRSGAAWAGSWTVVEASAGLQNDYSSSVQRGIQPAGNVYNQLGVVYSNRDASPDNVRFEKLTVIGNGEVTMQGVAAATLDPSFVYSVEAALQGVATLGLDPQARYGGDMLLQGVARITIEGEGAPFHDYTVYDCYLESFIRSEGLLFYDQQKPETVSRKLTPTRQDVGNNPEEIRPEFGDMFAQGDFSHGSGQRYFHQAGRDPKKYWYSEGFDISEPGKLTHLRTIAEARDSANIGRIEQVGDLPFVINGQRVDRGDGSWPGTWTAEDPSGADPDQNVMDICAEGARLYAAINTATASVRIRDSGGTWAHFQVAGVDLVVGTATRLAWLKSRLMVVGGTLGRSIYEVAASATPTAIETLPEGWTFVDLFEAQGFIHATAVNTAAGLSRVHHYGLNSTFSAIEKKSSTAFPQGQIINAGCGFPGLAFVAGGVRNSSGGYDPILYRAGVGTELGELQYEEIRQETGAGAADLSVRAVIPMGESILTGWSLGSGAYGGARDGIAAYHIGRNAFVHNLRKTASGGAQRVGGIMPFKGRVLISITGDGLYYENLTTYYTPAELHTSAADWNNAGLKVWDQIEISHDPLAANHSFAVAYTTETFETATWNPVFTSDVDGDTRASSRLSNVKDRQFALRITSTATTSATPVFLAYTVRSLPSPSSPEFQLTRYIRLLGKDRKDEDAPFIFNDPDVMLAFLQDSIYSVVNFHESNASWIAWLEDVSTVEPEQPFYDLTKGESLKDAFVVRLQMTGTR